MEKKNLVILNQAVNYLTIGFANAFSEKFDEVVLITGSIHNQGEVLSDKVKIHYINRWHERPISKKLISYSIAMIKMWWLLKTKYSRHEVFFVSVPPMGYLINLALPNKFSMVIWDVYPDIFKITGMKENHLLFRIWGYLNKKSFQKAYRLFTIGDKMAELIESYVNRKKIIVQPIWSIFQENKKIDKISNPFIELHNLQNKFIVQYSGNIGVTHKVEVVVQLAELLKNEKNIIFQIIGRGPRVPALKKMVEKKNLPNCIFLPFQSDQMFPYSLSAADLGIVILDELTSKGSVPSKSYNLMSYGIPSLYIAGKDSELNSYTLKYQHAACYTEKELEEAKEFILKLSIDKDVWNIYSENAIITSKLFRRENADKFVADYLNI
jgi:hypothetical protein